MRAIITRGLYTFYSILEGKKRFLRSFFRKILPLCTVSIQERVMMARVQLVCRLFNYNIMQFIQQPENNKDETQ